MKKSLYNIEQEYLEIAQLLEEGELTEGLEKALIIVQDELQTKAVNYGFVIKDLDDDITAIDNEIKRLQAIKKSKQNAQNYLKENIKRAMLNFGIDKVEVPTLKLSFRRSEAVNITDESIIPNKYLKTTVSVDKAKLKKALKDGEVIEGAVIKENQNLQIK